MAGGDRRNADSALLTALAGGATVRDAAAAAGVSERTAHRRLEDPGFRGRVDAARAALVSRAVAMLADSSTEAAATLRRLLGAESETVQLGAARSILELGAKLREGEELEKRVAALEEAAAADDPPLRGRRWGA